MDLFSNIFFFGLLGEFPLVGVMFQGEVWRTLAVGVAAATRKVVGGHASSANSDAFWVPHEKSSAIFLVAGFHRLSLAIQLPALVKELFRG